MRKQDAKNMVRNRLSVCKSRTPIPPEERMKWDSLCSGFRVQGSTRNAQRLNAQRINGTGDGLRDVLLSVIVKSKGVARAGDKEGFNSRRDARAVPRCLSAFSILNPQPSIKKRPEPGRTRPGLSLLRTSNFALRIRTSTSSVRRPRRRVRARRRTLGARC